MVSRVGMLAQPMPDMEPEDDGSRFGSMFSPQRAGPEGMDGKVKENLDWLQAPETQAALMSFALSIMQPVGSPQELMGQFARSVGAGFQAAGSVQTSEAEAEKEAQKTAMEQAEFNLRRRKLELEESQFEEELQTKGQVKRSIMISSNNPLNKSFELGIPEGSSAKVEVTYDKTGRILSADLETVDKPDKVTPSETSKLLDEAAAAEKAGDTDRAKILRDKVALETSREPSEITKLDREIEEAEAKGDLKLAAELRRKQKNAARSGEPAESELSKLQRERDEAIVQGREQDALSLQGQIDKLSKEAPPEESNLARLQRERDEALAAGDTKKAAELDLEIKTESAGDSGITGEGQMIVADPSEPSGVRIVNVPGGKAATEQGAAEVAENSRKAQSMFQAAIVRTRVDQAIKIIENTPNPNLKVTGIGGLAQYLPASDANQLSGYIQTIKANLGFEQLQRMRESSPTGGALGPVSDFENLMLQSVVSSLDQYGDAEYLKEQLRLVKAATTAIVNGGTADIVARLENGDITEDEAMMMMESLFQSEALNAKQKAAIGASPGTAATAAQPTPQTGVPSRQAPAAGGVEERPSTVPPPRAELSPEDQIDAAVLEETERLKTKYPEGAPPAVEPADLTEKESTDWDFMTEDERHIYLQLRDELKREEEELRKQKPSTRGGKRKQKPPSALRKFFLGEAAESDFPGVIEHTRRTLKEK